MDYISNFIKLNILSEISKDIGQIFFAAVVVEPIISKTSNILVFLIGFIFSLGFWLLSIRLSTNE